MGSADVPPVNAAEAVAWWRVRHPDMPVREICERVGRSERTVSAPPGIYFLEVRAGRRSALVRIALLH